MKILWVTSCEPDLNAPGRAGHEAQLLRAAAATHDIAVLSSAIPGGTVDLDLGDRSIPMSGVSWRVRRGVSSRLTFPVHVLRSWPNHQWLLESRLRALRAAIAFHQERTPVDLVHFAGFELASLVATCRVPATLLVFNLPSRPGDLAGDMPAPARPLRNRERRRIASWERRWLAQFAAAASTSDDVASVLRTLTASPVTVFPPRTGEQNPDWPFAELWGDTDAEGAPAASAKPDAEPAKATSATSATSATIIVCTRDRPDLLRQAIPFLAANLSTDHCVDLMIVEQGARTSAALCRELGTPATVLHDEGKGASRARNVGFHHTSSDVILFTDDDCAVPPDWVDSHLRALAESGANASFGVVTGLSRPPGQEPATAASDLVGRRALHWNGSPPWLVGHSANMAVRRTALIAVGTFDERVGPGTRGSFIGEDADLIVRLLRSAPPVVSGVGEPVSHVEWRNADETSRNLIAYERGSGAWIGKMLRTDRQLGLHHLRSRADLLRSRVRAAPGVPRDPVTVVRSIGGFVRGLVHGYRLGEWRAPTPSVPTIESVAPPSRLT